MIMALMEKYSDLFALANQVGPKSPDVKEDAGQLPIAGRTEYQVDANLMKEMMTMRKGFLWSLGLMLALALPAFAGQAAPAKAAQAKAPAAVVNLNTASESDLVALPGVGPATAKKIIAGRPYTSVADLAKAGVPKNTIEKISSMVTVGAANSAAAAAPAPKPAPAAPAPAPAASATARTPSAPAAAQQPPVKGMVWVNLSTKVFHREGDRYYGNTKNGKFMTEADAVKAGYREAKTEKKKTP
jgi:DNA uptake protein ComE-like DNA-binding protein